MYPILIKLTDSLAIHSYGVAIACGILLAFYGAKRDPLRKALMSEEVMSSGLTWLIITMVTGGRMLFIISEPHGLDSFLDYIAVWDGGLSVLGAIVSGTLFLCIYAQRHSVPLLPTCDLAARYAPLVQFFGRIGCFLAGCCAGIPTHSWIGVTYTNPACQAPLNVPLHPTQLYSAFFYLLLFAVFYNYSRTLPLKQQLTSAAGLTTAFYFISTEQNASYSTSYAATEQLCFFMDYQLINLFLLALYSLQRAGSFLLK